MKPISLKNAVSLSHLIVQSYIPTAKIIVDMTSVGMGTIQNSWPARWTLNRSYTPLIFRHVL